METPENENEYDIVFELLVNSKLDEIVRKDVMKLISRYGDRMYRTGQADIVLGQMMAAKRSKEELIRVLTATKESEDRELSDVVDPLAQLEIQEEL